VKARGRITALAALCLAAAACGREPPAPNPGPSPDAEQITGNERIGWDQPSATAEDLATFRYAVYVDGARHDLPDASCAATPGPAGFPCSARPPAMPAGRHTIELVAYTDAGGVLESARSSPLVVVVVAAASIAAAVPPGQVDVTTADGVQLRAEVIAGGFEDVTDIAAAADGRLYVAERDGRIRIIRGGRLATRPAVVLDDAVASRGGGLLAIAIGPDFERSGFVFAAHIVGGGVRVTRLRAVEDTLGDPVVVIDGIPVANIAPVVSLRFGPDGRLYLGVDDGGDASRAGDLGSFSGKVLRFNPDGTTPADQAGGTPVFASNVNRPGAIAFDARGTMWVVDRARAGSDMLHAVVAESPASGRGRTVVRYAFPLDAPASGVASYDSERAPGLRGDLLVPSAEGRALLRLRFDPADSRRLVASERLLQDVFGAIHAVAVSSDGVVYLASDTGLVKVDH
jgi:glucose/arabinose dehydrogenase